jgi:hypothetical protein
MFDLSWQKPEPCLVAISVRMPQVHEIGNYSCVPVNSVDSTHRILHCMVSSDYPILTFRQSALKSQNRSESYMRWISFIALLQRATCFWLVSDILWCSVLFLWSWWDVPLPSVRHWCSCWREEGTWALSHDGTKSGGKCSIILIRDPTFSIRFSLSLGL